MVLWTAGSRPVTKAGNDPSRTPALPFPADTRGALRTDPTLRVLDHPRVFALGDVAGPAAAAVAAEASTSGVAAYSFPATAQVSLLAWCTPASDSCHHGSEQGFFSIHMPTVECLS